MRFELASQDNVCGGRCGREVRCLLPIPAGSLKVVLYKRNFHPRCLPGSVLSADPSAVAGWSSLSAPNRASIAAAFAPAPPAPPPALANTRFEIASQDCVCVARGCDLPILAGSLKAVHHRHNFHSRCLPGSVLSADPSAVAGWSSLSAPNRASIAAAFAAVGRPEPGARAAAAPPPALANTRFELASQDYVCGGRCGREVRCLLPILAGSLKVVHHKRNFHPRCLPGSVLSADPSAVAGWSSLSAPNRASIAAAFAAVGRPEPGARAAAAPPAVPRPKPRYGALANGGASRAPAPAAPRPAPAPRLELSHVPASSAPPACAACSHPVAPPGAVFLRGASALAYHVDCVSPALCREALADDLVGMGGGELEKSERAMVRACFRETVMDDEPAAPATTTTTSTS
ncbi:hypothetical protein TeGR_g3402, partial [Tetraparma gracilis]